MMHILVRHLNHHSIVLSNTAGLVTMETIQQSPSTCGHQIDVNDVNILDREEDYIERGVIEAVWIRTTNPSLDSNGGTRIMLSHFWDCALNTLRSFFSISDNFKK